MSWARKVLQGNGPKTCCHTACHVDPDPKDYPYLHQWHCLIMCAYCGLLIAKAFRDTLPRPSPHLPCWTVAAILRTLLQLVSCTAAESTGVYAIIVVMIAQHSIPIDLQKTQFCMAQHTTTCCPIGGRSCPGYICMIQLRAFKSASIASLLDGQSRGQWENSARVGYWGTTWLCVLCTWPVNYSISLLIICRHTPARSWGVER